MAVCASVAVRVGLPVLPGRGDRPVDAVGRRDGGADVGVLPAERRVLPRGRRKKSRDGRVVGALQPRHRLREPGLGEVVGARAGLVGVRRAKVARRINGDSAADGREHSERDQRQEERDPVLLREPKRRTPHGADTRVEKASCQVSHRNVGSAQMRREHIPPSAPAGTRGVPRSGKALSARCSSTPRAARGPRTGRRSSRSRGRGRTGSASSGRRCRDARAGRGPG